MRLAVSNTFLDHLTRLLTRHVASGRVRNDSQLDCAHGIPLAPTPPDACPLCRNFREVYLEATRAAARAAEAPAPSALALRCAERAVPIVNPSLLGLAELTASALDDALRTLRDRGPLVGAEARLSEALDALLTSRLHELRRPATTPSPAETPT